MNKNSKMRYRIIDVIRGSCVIFMIFYHALVDMYLWQDLPYEILFNPVMNFLQVVFAGLFITISGVSTGFTRSNLKRGFIMLGSAIIVTISTYIMNSSSFVVYGILHFLGTAAILYSILPKFKINPIVCLFAFIITRQLLLPNFEIPHLWIFGITDSNFISSDYFGLFPWIFLYYLGIWLSDKIRQNKLPEFVYNVRCKPLELIGTKTLIIYLVHQPILFLLLYNW